MHLEIEDVIPVGRTNVPKVEPPQLGVWKNLVEALEHPNRWGRLMQPNKRVDEF